VQSRNLANVSGAVVELSNYLEQRISSKSEEFAKVGKRSVFIFISMHHMPAFLLACQIFILTFLFFIFLSPNIVFQFF
jgi:hypothetical protein